MSNIDPKVAGAVVAMMLCCSSSSAAALMMGGGRKKYRYVRVGRTKIADDNALNLTEVEVLAGGVNVAAGKTVTGKNLYSPTFPHRFLTDGNMSNFAHGLNDPEEWFQIDLGREYDIDKVVVTNRRDCCQGRAINLKIQLSDSADMNSPKSSRVITAAEAPRATFTWNVPNDVLTAA